MLGVVIFLKIGAYWLCETLNKGTICHSTSLAQSSSHGFLIANYFLVKSELESDFGFNNQLKLSSIFVERPWSYQCTIVGINQIPKEINIGQVGVVLPIEVKDEKQLAKLDFYLLAKEDTIVLRGNRLPKTEYKNLIDNLDLSGTELLIVDEKVDNCLKFKLVRER